MPLNTESKPNADAIQVGMWNSNVASDPRKLMSLNREPIDITKDQMIQLYMLLYPFIASEFSHRSDIKSYLDLLKSEFTKEIDKINKNFTQLKIKFNSHTHQGVQSGPGTTAPPSSSVDTNKIKIWETDPEDRQFKFGENLIVDKSEYSRNIRHRNPTLNASNLTTQQNIVQEINKQFKYIPFDISDKHIAGPDEYAGT